MVISRGRGRERGRGRYDPVAYACALLSIAVRVFHRFPPFVAREVRSSLRWEHGVNVVFVMALEVLLILRPFHP